jgi:type IV pilus biogenesis protein CpaD/CtpE
MRRLPHFLAALVALALVAAACADPAPTNTEPAPDGDAAWRNGDSSFLFD